MTDMANIRTMDIGNLRFLVVEDQGFQRWALGKLLKGLGARFIFPAPDGNTALELMREAEEPIDVVVSDLDMPEMDGMEFIRHLTQEFPEASLIIVSGLERSLIDTVEKMARAYGANFLGAIEKPPTAAKLEALIRLNTRTAGHAPKRVGRKFEPEEILAGIRRGEFEPYFQPKVEIETRRVRGAEANARWNHPQEGLIFPGAFIEPLERAGLIDELTVKMVEASARACRRWIEGGLAASVAVNLSVKSLNDVALADRMTALVEAQGLRPGDMVFEITESAASGEIAPALEILARLRMKGFGLSIDDYGTGYSSMQRLTHVPFTELKIDRLFLKNATTQPSSRAMIESSLEMAQKLKIVAVAEGVESEDEWQLLRSLQCPIAQGYYVARPMREADFRAWVQLQGKPR
jgi:EAL domain-containing protein (putative c-di-GMP-specific phosphodiesterase class I)